jgi:hypothetical protein
MGMTREQLKERLQVIQAWCDGKEVQWLNTIDEWVDFEEGDFDGIMTQDWRIKPTPQALEKPLSEILCQGAQHHVWNITAEGKTACQNCGLYSEEWLRAFRGLGFVDEWKVQAEPVTASECIEILNGNFGVWQRCNPESDNSLGEIAAMATARLAYLLKESAK